MWLGAVWESSPARAPCARLLPPPTSPPGRVAAVSAMSQVWLARLCYRRCSQVRVGPRRPLPPWCCHAGGSEFLQGLSSAFAGRCCVVSRCRDRPGFPSLDGRLTIQSYGRFTISLTFHEWISAITKLCIAERCCCFSLHDNVLVKMLQSVEVFNMCCKRNFRACCLKCFEIDVENT